LRVFQKFVDFAGECIMNVCRLFIGLALPDGVSRRLAARMERLAGRLPFARWTHPADLHVTLLFLGETPAGRVEEVSRMVRETAAGAAPFTLELTEPGTFGPPSAPRVLWCGVAERSGTAEGEADRPAQGALSALHAALCARAEAAGFPRDPRPFRPHVTLARAGNAACGPAAVAAAWREAVAAEEGAAHGAPAGTAAASRGPLRSADAGSLPPGPSGLLVWRADRLTLFRSHLGRRPSYERLSEYRFGR